MWLQDISDDLKATGGFDGDGKQTKSSTEASCDKLHYIQDIRYFVCEVKIYSGKTQPKAPHLQELPA